MVLLLLVLSILTGPVHSKGVGEIQFQRYADYDTDCGDLDGSACDFYFKPLKIQDEDGNVMKNIAKTKYTSNKANVDLTKVEELRDPIEVTVPTNKTVRIVTKVWDSDYNADDYVREITDFIVPFNEVSVSDNWVQKTETIVQRKVQFIIKYRLTQCDPHFTGQGCNFCKAHYYAEECNVNCVQVPGNYTCDQNTGDKICKKGKIGDNCDECENGKVGQNCDHCKGNFVEPNCDTCADNYYPEDRCDVLCEPDPDQKYTCTDQGERKCLGNREGVNCEECKPDFYKEDCSEFCKENKYYNCTRDGEKVCHDTTANPEDNCGRSQEDEERDKEEAEKKEKEETSDNTALIGAAGAGGGLLLILAGTALTLVIRKRRRKHGENTSTGGGDEDKPGELYSTVNKPPPRTTPHKQPRSGDQDMYSRLNRPQGADTQQLGSDDQDMYSRINRSRGDDKQQPGSDEQDMYSRINRPRGPDTQQLGSDDPAEEGETYADVAFVKSREKGPVAVYRNTGVEEEGDESTYIAVTELI